MFFENLGCQITQVGTLQPTLQKNIFREDGGRKEQSELLCPKLVISKTTIKLLFDALHQAFWV